MTRVRRSVQHLVRLGSILTLTFAVTFGLSASAHAQLEAVVIEAESGVVGSEFSILIQAACSTPRSSPPSAASIRPPMRARSR